MAKLLVISHDYVGHRMAGVGIRYTEIAKALAVHPIDVTLAAPCGSRSPCEGVRFVLYAPGKEVELAEELRSTDAVLCYPDMLYNLSPVLPDDLPVIVDGYDLNALEQLAVQRYQPDLDFDTWHRGIIHYTLRRGDFFICATQRQRDWWLGALDAAGRINPANYCVDPTFRHLVSLVPYGIPSAPPRAPRRVMRGVWPGISDTDIIVLWGGGIWEWFDPFTLLDALILLRANGLAIKCVFPGARPPGQSDWAMPRFEEFRLAAARARLLDETVLLGEWADYADWAGYLTEATIGISLHFDQLESHFSVRTRTLSYIWAALPMVLTAGDELAELAARHGVARLVPPQNAASVAAAIVDAVQIRARPDCAELFRPLQERFHWSRCVEPIARFMRAPRRAADAQAAPKTL